MSCIIFEIGILIHCTFLDNRSDFLVEKTPQEDSSDMWVIFVLSDHFEAFFKARAESTFVIDTCQVAIKQLLDVIEIKLIKLIFQPVDGVFFCHPLLDKFMRLDHLTILLLFLMVHFNEILKSSRHHASVFLR
jgi:hypothetical protein